MADEVEGKLIIVGTDASAVYDAVAALDAIAGYTVARRDEKQISDVFFDTPDRRLFAARVALRVRTENGRALLTLKGETRVEDGVLSREELEVEWSPEGLDEVLETLSQVGFGDIDAAREVDSPHEAMAALGLEPSSPRENRRTALTLQRDGIDVAEVAVDAVTITAGERTVRHYEIECESKGNGNAAIIREVLGELQTRFEAMRTSAVSKLDLANALEKLERRGELAPLLDGERLRPEAYDAVEAVLLE